MVTKKTLSFILILFTMMVSCDLTDPFSLPSWNTQWKLFFRTEEVTFREMLEDGSLKDSLSAEYGDTLVFLSIADTSDRQEIDDEEMTFEPEDDHITEEVGDIELDDPDPQSPKPISLEELLGIPIVEDSDIGPVAEQDIILTPDSSYVHFDEYKRIVVKDGIMFLTFHNDLTIDINSGMVISLYDSASNVLINNFTFNKAIAQGQISNSDTLLIDGLEMFNAFYLNYVVPIAGIDSVHTVTNEDVNSKFVVDVKLKDLTIDEGEAQIPEQDIDRSDASLLDTEDKSIIRAVIDSGFINVSIENTLDLDANVQIEILSLIDESNNNQPMVVDTFLARTSTTFIKKDIKGKTIVNNENPGAFVDSIRYVVTGTTVETEDYREVASTQVLNVDVDMGEVKTSEFEGEITNLSIDIDPIEKSDLIDLKDFSGTFRMPDLELIFDFHNQIGFDIMADLEITGIKEENGVATDSVKILIEDYLINKAPSPNSTEITTLILNGSSTTPSIVDLMEILPTIIKVEGQGVIENQTGIVKLGDAIWTEYRIESPMRILITDPFYYNDDIEEMDIDSDTRVSLSEDYDNVLLKINPENGIPLNFELIFVMALDTTDMFSDMVADSSEKIILHKKIDAGVTNADGLVISPTINNNVQLKLNKKQLQIFTKKDNSGSYLPVYNAMQIRVDSNNESVIFRNSDALNYDGYIDLKYKVDGNDL